MMNTLKMKLMEPEPEVVQGFSAGLALEKLIAKMKEGMSSYQEYILFVGLLLMWFVTSLVSGDDRALVTDGLWQLVLMSAICFLGMVGLSWWLLKRFWTIMGLPELGGMVIRFKQMKSCYQLGFYLASFALLLLAALGCLIAVL